MGWFALHRIPLRISMLVLGILVLAPIVLLISWLFPGLSRETIAVSLAFCLAAYLAFFVFGRRKAR